jgi:hypothetical protein
LLSRILVSLADLILHAELVISPWLAAFEDASGAEASEADAVQYTTDAHSRDLCIESQVKRKLTELILGRTISRLDGWWRRREEEA